MFPSLCGHHQALPHNTRFLGSIAHPVFNIPQYMLALKLQFLLSDNNLIPENTLIAYLITKKLSWDSLLRLQAPLLAESVIL